MKPRIKLVQVSPTILSSYPIGRPRNVLKPLQTLAAGYATPDAASAITALHVAVSGVGGDFRVTDCFRSAEMQGQARAKYETWLRAGKPSPGGPGWNGTTMKADYVAQPGFSNHNAGRAVDLDIGSLKFPGVVADKQLDTLWALAKPLGWRPIIKTALEGASESWHFDFWGPWLSVLERRGYAEAAMAACLDIGVASYGMDDARCLQAQLHRAGYDVGAIDGIIGKRTIAALAACGAGSTRSPEVLYELPDSYEELWS